MLKTLTTNIEDAIQAAGPEIREQYVKIESTKEISRRVSVLADLVSTTESVQKDLESIKPEIKEYKIDGSPANTGTYTKSQVDRIKQLQERISKAEVALTEVLRTNTAESYEVASKVIAELKGQSVNSLTK